MVAKIAKAVFGSKNDRVVKRMRKAVRKINELEESVQSLNDDQLRAKTDEFRSRLAQGESLDNLIPEAFAVVREAAHRTLGMRHFDVQLIGGMVLHQGKIAEMRTGEGKTLVATLAAYLNALPGDGVHIVTVNDYLASRDAQWMAPVYQALGLSVGIIQSFRGAGTANSFVVEMKGSGEPLRVVSRQEAYAADITYGTNNEFGFDYLRDNMALRLEDKSQRGHAFAIVDEVDSILIDEARTPLIISGAAQDSSALYKRVNALVQLLKRETESDSGEVTPGDFVIDEKTRQVELTEAGHQRTEELLINDGLLEPNDSLYQATNLSLLHHIHSALRAHNLFHRDVEYIVQNGEVVLIDEHTGRTMPGRRLSEGLHQAIEAKEGVNIQSESQTLASTTFQNYFRIYDKLAGMTGTADTEAYEFHQIYGLEVVVIPPNKPVVRKDLNDLVFLSQEEKYAAVIEDIKKVVADGAPVLVGTVSIETSEYLAGLLKKAGIEHQVLNAKFHEKEASIIAQAGRPGAVTIATNMAGRGTDIVLGGNWEAEMAALDNPTPEQVDKLKEAWKQRQAQVLKAGGLHILGTERHESRRIDNQLRGRAGRQGDPGVTRFYLSLEDPLMRLFASDRVRNMMRSLGMQQGESIEHRMVTNSIEKAQRKVEGRNFDIRKQLLEFDDVANDQRQVIYQQRNELLESDDISDIVAAIRGDVVNQVIDNYIPPQSISDQWDIPGLEEALFTEFGLKLPVQSWLDEDKRLHEDKIRERIAEAVSAAYQDKCQRIGDDIRVIEKQIMLQVLDMLWKEHLSNMDYLRQGIGLRAYAQKNPRQEYKRESFALFQTMLENIKLETVRFLSRLEVRSHEEVEELERRQREQQARQKMDFQHAESSALSEEAAVPEPASEPAQPYVREGEKVGRNDPCPCGSGKKYKQCHGRLA
ncbi:MAG: preprotein translocase subunit SecA [Porticoccaceae bacterium]|nr:preprotein translocase subunit SecA [Porticoccaceae bacterium]